MSESILKPNNINMTIDSDFENNISTSSENTTTWGEWFSSITWKTWAIIIFILALLGFNIFMYLAKGTQDVANIFRPIIEKITKIFVGTTSQVIDVSAEGAKGAINTVAKVSDTTLTDIQDGLPSSSGISAIGTTTLNPQKKTSESTYEADDSMSPIQSSNAGKSGWCFIGEERNVRTCAKVGSEDQCLSGNVYPSQEVCMYPKQLVS